MKTTGSKQTKLIPVLLLIMAACDCDITGPKHRSVDIDIDPQPFQASEQFSYDVPTAGQAAVQLKGVNGTVRFEGSDDHGTVRVTGIRRVRSDSQQDAKDHLAAVQVLVSEGEHEILIESQHPRNDGRNYEVDYTVTLPRHLDAIVKSVNGGVTLVGLVSKVDVDLTNGKIVGDLDLPTGGEIELFTVNGEIDLTVQRDASATFQATLTHGNITTANLPLSGTVETPRSLIGMLGAGAGSIRLALVNGDIRVAGR